MEINIYLTEFFFPIIIIIIVIIVINFMLILNKKFVQELIF
jgi:hypothetical protein